MLGEIVSLLEGYTRSEYEQDILGGGRPVAPGGQPE